MAEVGCFAGTCGNMRTSSHVPCEENERLGSQLLKVVRGSATGAKVRGELLRQRQVHLLIEVAGRGVHGSGGSLDVHNLLESDCI